MVANASQTGRCRLSMVFMLVMLAATVQAQFYETIRSGRPGQSIGASTVGKHIIQIQSGVDHFGFERVGEMHGGDPPAKVYTSRTQKPKAPFRGYVSTAYCLVWGR